MIKATDIKWNTDGEDIDLPSEIVIPDDFKGDIGDYISDVTGFCHFGYSIEGGNEEGEDDDDKSECLLCRIRKD